MSHPISSWFVLYSVIIISYYYYSTFIIIIDISNMLLYYVLYLYYKMVLPTLRLWPFLALMDALTKRCGCEGLRLRSAVNVKSGSPKKIAALLRCKIKKMRIQYIKWIKINSNWYYCCYLSKGLVFWMKWIQHGSYSEVNPKESSSLLSRRHSRIMSDRGMDRKCWGAKVELYHGENTCFLQSDIIFTL